MKTRFFRLPKTRFFKPPWKINFFRYPKNGFSRAPRKSESFRFRKIAFSVRNDGANSLFPKNRFLGRHGKGMFSISEISLSQGAIKNLFLKELWKNFFFFRKNAFQCSTKNYFYGFRKICFPRRQEKGLFSGSEKFLSQGVMKNRFFRTPKNHFSRALRKSYFFGSRKIVSFFRFPKNRFFRAPRKSNFFVSDKSFYWAALIIDFYFSGKSIFIELRKTIF